MSITATDANGLNPVELEQIGSTNVYIDGITAIPYHITNVGTEEVPIYHYSSEYIPAAVTNSDDFIGFSFNGVTSQSLGISRVSDGSRYNEQMLPGFQDKSAQMPGSDYTLYWESFYNTRTWTLSIAFDHMIDDQMREFRRTFDTKKMGELKFAERTYTDENNGIHQIHWLAKVQSPPQLKYICFDEDGQRIYKGEGTITFIAYYPFGMSELNTYTFTGSHLVQNLGEFPMEWKLMIPLGVGGQNAYKVTRIAYGNSGTLVLQFNNGLAPYIPTTDTYPDSDKHYYCLEHDDNTGDWCYEWVVPSIFDPNIVYYECLDEDADYVCVSSKTNLIEGYKIVSGELIQTGKMYNRLITSGDFFQIPTNQNYNFYCNGTGTLEYNYLYL